MASWADKTPAEIMADVQAFRDAVDTTKPQSIRMDRKTWMHFKRELFRTDKPNVFRLSAAGWRAGLTVNGIDP